jgi:hypothetical protein
MEHDYMLQQMTDKQNEAVRLVSKVFPLNAEGLAHVLANAWMNDCPQATKLASQLNLTKMHFYALENYEEAFNECL